MAQITAAMVKQLREMTDSPMMECKKALVEADGDMDAAVDVLRKNGLAKAAKKAGRETNEGAVAAFVSEDSKTGALLELSCETDFVGSNAKFTGFATNVAEVVATTEPADLDALLAAPMNGATVSEELTEMIHVMGENMKIARFAARKVETGALSTYIHMGGKIGVIVAAKTADAEKARPAVHDVAMHIAAAKPGVLHRDEVDPADLDKEREILRAQALNDPKPKPANIIEKMVEGRIAKYYKEVCLLEQPFVKNPDQSIEQMLKEHGDVELVAFVRFEMGEGLQKRQDNFAEEVMGQMKK